MADVLDACGQALDELFVKDANGLGTVVVPVDTDDTVVLSARLAVFKELFSGRSGQILLWSASDLIEDVRFIEIRPMRDIQ